MAMSSLVGSSSSRLVSGEVSKAADWELCLQLLRNKSSVVQSRAARHLRQYLVTAQREMGIEAFARFESELFQRVFALLRGNDLSDRLGGVAALDQLIDASTNLAETKLIKFSNNLSDALRTNTNRDVLVSVAKALGHMARSSAVPNVDYVEFEINRGLEWLHADSSHRRLAGCLVLKEMATNAPTAFYVKIKDLFERIMPLVADREVMVREAAADALSVCLSAIVQRASRSYLNWYFGIHDRILDGLKLPVNEAEAHGALLMTGAMLQYSGDFMVPRFKELCDAVMRLPFKKTPQIILRRTVMELLPKLAHFCPDAFAQSYLSGAIDCVVSSRTSPELKNSSYLALGQLALAVKGHLVGRLDMLVGLVNEGLTAPQRRKGPASASVAAAAAAALTCLANFVEALGDHMHPYVMDLLPAMFSKGLSEPLIETLAVISERMPVHKPQLQQRLLLELAVLLSGSPYEPPGSCPPWERMGEGGSSLHHRISDGEDWWDLSRPLPPGQAKDEDALILALHTLGGFKLEEFCLLPFVRDCVVRYLRHPNAHVRKEAALSCCQLLVDSGRPILTRGPSADVMEEVLSRLLHVAVSDPNASIRRTLIRALDSKFDRFLSQAHHLQTLFLLMGDEDFIIRLEAVSLLGRLAALNPAYLLPPLRATLAQLVLELRFSTTDMNGREEATRMLCCFLRAPALPTLVLPLLRAVIDALPLPGPAPLATAALEALGELSIVAGEAISPYLDRLIPVILDSMADQSSVLKREVSLRTLGRLVGATHCVVQPYLTYPNLMNRALAVLSGGTSAPWSLRRETLRTLGILGALDPFMYRKIQTQTSAMHSKPAVAVPAVSVLTAAVQPPAADRSAGDSGADSSSLFELPGGAGAVFAPTSSSPASLMDENDRAQPAHTEMWAQSIPSAQPSPSSNSPPQLTPASKDYYPTIAVQALMRILRDHSLSQHHAMVSQAVMFIFKSLGLRCVPFLEHILPNMLHVVRHCEAGLREVLLQQLGSLSGIVKQHIRAFLPQMFEIVVDYWDENQEQVVPLVEEMALNLKEAFRPFAPRLLPLLLPCLSPPQPVLVAMSSRNGYESDNRLLSRMLLRVKVILNTLKILRPVLVQYLHVVIPALMKLINSIGENGMSTHALQWQEMCIRTLLSLVSRGALLQHPSMAARMIHPLVRITGTDMESCQEAVLLRSAIMEAFCSIAAQLGPRYLIFDALVQKVVSSKVPPGMAATYWRTVRAVRAHASYESLSLSEAGRTPLGGMAALCSALGDSAEEYLGPYAGRPIDNSWSPGPYVDLMTTGGSMVQHLHVNQQNLQRAWDVSQRGTQEDWVDWMRRFRVALLRESPSPALRSCSALAQVYPPIGRELFHAAFVSCWLELNDQYQEHLVRSLEMVFRASEVPPETLQVLLNLAEFMEHDVEALPIDIRVLANLAMKCRAYAKALHYKEIEFQSAPAQCVEDLIAINKKLGQPEAAIGILAYAQSRLGSVITVKESWLAKLGHWEEALSLYKRRLETKRDDVTAVIGCMKCMDALGDWGELVKLCDNSWEALKAAPEDKLHRKAATLAARATWNLGDWLRFDQYVSAIEVDNVEGAFFRAILATHNQDFDACAMHIDRTRRLLDSTFTALVEESYRRAYSTMVTIQQLAELEEIVGYLKVLLSQTRGSGGLNHNAMVPSALAGVPVGEAEQAWRKLIHKWYLRLRGCTPEVHIWQSILAVHSLVLSPVDDIQSWLQLANLCQQSGNFSLSRKILLSPLGPSIAEGPNLPAPRDGLFLPQSQMDPTMSHHSNSNHTHHLLRFAYLKHQWASGADRAETLRALRELVDCLSPAEMELQVQCLLKLGHWELSQVPPGREMPPSVQSSVSMSYKHVTELQPDNYTAWHSWGMVNFRLVEQLTRQGHRHSTAFVGIKGPRAQQLSYCDQAALQQHLVSAADGFIHAIALGRKMWSALVQQDMLNLLSIWFHYGSFPNVQAVLSSGLAGINLDNWLGVVPQLIARINIAHNSSRALLHALLDRMGRRHPQALVYPLSVALKSPRGDRRDAAAALMATLQQHDAALMREALLVSDELIRVAILWHEQWHEGLEEASRLYFGNGNVRGMLAVLLPLHEMLEAGAVTNREDNFQQAFGRDLREAYECITRYRRVMQDAGLPIPSRRGAHKARSAQQMRYRSDADMALNQAWDLYYTVFRKINKQLPQMTMLELQYVSPQLLSARDLELAVPGTYRVSGTAVRISYFHPTVQVIPSKQRPRKIVMRGEDGRDYVFLLKGHEDLRQDERVMQLFGQVNALLATDQRTNKHDLSIQRYTVTPLSHNAGVVGWVPNSDTLHALIRDYRERRKILLNIEHRLMSQAASPCEYDQLTLMQKVEVFQMALKHTAGQDLYRVLWLKSENSEAWLDRRTNFTRSLAVMSMVGYILGLGDRHPSNLMLDRHTGKVLHIDFGDCFEVAMHRDKFPEKVPFRLTRMLCNAMEVSGVEGNFRTTCERVMAVLRESRDSLIAMLEAFVHDPLISWRLLGAPQNLEGGEDAETKDEGPEGEAVAMEDDGAEQAINGHARAKGSPAGSSTPAALAMGKAHLMQESDESPITSESSSFREGEEEAPSSGSHNGSSANAPALPAVRRVSANMGSLPAVAEAQLEVDDEGDALHGRVPAKIGIVPKALVHVTNDEDGNGEGPAITLSARKASYGTTPPVDILSGRGRPLKQRSGHAETVEGTRNYRAKVGTEGNGDDEAGNDDGDGSAEEEVDCDSAKQGANGQTSSSYHPNLHIQMQHMAASLTAEGLRFSVDAGGANVTSLAASRMDHR